METQTELMDDYLKLQQELDFFLQSSHSLLESSEAFTPDVVQGFLSMTMRITDDFKAANKRLVESRHTH